MNDFENFLCFSSAMARCGGTGSAETRGRKSSALPVPPHRAIAEEKQRNFSKSFISSDH